MNDPDSVGAIPLESSGLSNQGDLGGGSSQGSGAGYAPDNVLQYFRRAKNTRPKGARSRLEALRAALASLSPVDVNEASANAYRFSRRAGTG
jgi:hypothetical protein